MNYIKGGNMDIIEILLYLPITVSKKTNMWLENTYLTLKLHAPKA